MSWMKGVGPLKSVKKYGIKKGLSKNWYSSSKYHKKNRKEIKKGSYWGVRNNPLYEVAAEALGYDWDDWVKKARKSAVSGKTRVRAMVRKARKPTYTEIWQGDDGSAQYKWMTVDEAESRGLSYKGHKTTRWKNKKTGEIVSELVDPNKPKPGELPRQTKKGGGFTPGYNPLRRVDKDWKKDWVELRDWSVSSKSISEDLDKMSKWLKKIVNVNDHLHPIIRKGPQGKHYGITGDVWKHYGLDEEPEPPKELEWDSYDKKMQLATAVKSNAGYSTPEGITPVNLHGA